MRAASFNSLSYCRMLYSLKSFTANGERTDGALADQERARQMVLARHTSEISPKHAFMLACFGEISQDWKPWTIA